MEKIKFDFAIIKTISFFQTVTHTDVKDCFDIDGKFYFIVPAGQIGKAIGKNTANVKKLEDKLKKKIRIIEFNENRDQFIRNIVYPLKVSEVEFDEATKVLKLTAMDSKTRGYLIGRQASNLRNYERIIKRHFDVKELKVN